MHNYEIAIKPLFRIMSTQCGLKRRVPMGNCGNCGKTVNRPLDRGRGRPRGVFVSFAEGDGLFCSMQCAGAAANQPMRVVCERAVTNRTPEPELEKAPSASIQMRSILISAYSALRWIGVIVWNCFRTYT